MIQRGYKSDVAGRGENKSFGRCKGSGGKIRGIGGLAAPDRPPMDKPLNILLFADDRHPALTLIDHIKR